MMAEPGLFAEPDRVAPLEAVVAASPPETLQWGYAQPGRQALPLTRNQPPFGVEESNDLPVLALRPDEHREQEGALLGSVDDIHLDESVPARDSRHLHELLSHGMAPPRRSRAYPAVGVSTAGAA